VRCARVRTEVCCWRWLLHCRAGGRSLCDYFASSCNYAECDIAAAATD